MKKILLSALFCGFVLNNSYCFSEWRKISVNYLDGVFSNLVKIRQNTIDTYDFMITNCAMDLSTMDLSVVVYLSRFKNYMIYNINKIINSNLNKLVSDLLSSRITSGKNKGKTVYELLMERKFDENTLRTICCDSLSCNVKQDESRYTIGLQSRSRMVEIYVPFSYDKPISSQLCF